MKTIFRLAVVAIMVSFYANGYSQVGVTSYSFYALGINTSQNKPISGELKIFANRDISNLLTEANIFYNFKPRTYHRFSIGLGLNVGPFRNFDHIHAITVPAQLEIYPLRDFKKLSLMFELAPEFIPENNVRLRHLWGIRYTFGNLEE